jgi:acetyl-CoA acetyltransferase
VSAPANRVFIAGTGMTTFGKGCDIRLMAASAADEALRDAGLDPEQVERVYFGNGAAGLMLGQEMVRAQAILRHSRLAGRPAINVENACASGSSALLLAWEAVASGRAEVAAAIGAEQLWHSERARTFAALRGATDVAETHADPDGATNSVFMDVYAEEGCRYLEESDATVADFAMVAVKNRDHASLNPKAQYRTPQTVAEVLAGRTVANPLTLPMCSPTSDGAAAVVVCSQAVARKRGAPAVEIRAMALAPGRETGSQPVAEAASATYDASGLGPTDLDVAEVHDAAAPAELLQYADIGLCQPGEGHHLLRRGDTRLGGRIPVNTSGGLLSRGHPLGATGCAQIVELADQLRARAGDRQVDGARVALAVNGGGWIGGSYAVAVATILLGGST